MSIESRRSVHEFIFRSVFVDRTDPTCSIICHSNRYRSFAFFSFFSPSFLRSIHSDRIHVLPMDSQSSISRQQTPGQGPGRRDMTINAARSATRRPRDGAREPGAFTSFIHRFSRRLTSLRTRRKCRRSRWKRTGKILFSLRRLIRLPG